MTDTIVALASGRPPAAIAVIRISGPAAMPSLAGMTRRALPPDRRMVMRRLIDDRGETLDTALVVAFAGPATATGEDLVELHLHGGIAVVSAVLAALVGRPGVRLADPGEFTRRAFANGRLDLAQVEGLADLVAAETAAQRQQALALSGGALSADAEQWRERCLTILAEAEAGLDFAEEEADVAARLDEAADSALHDLIARIDALLADSARAARIRDGLTIAVAGAPNVGKSSLVNALSMRDAAIVTAIPGTTRDPIEVPVDLGGIAAILIDTAGLRDTDDPIEAEGIRRARARLAVADLVLHISDDPDASAPAGGVLVLNKWDQHGVQPSDGHSVSALTGEGIGALRDWLASWARALLRPGEPALIAHARHRAAYADAAAHLRGAVATADPVLRAEGLRLAARAFGRIAGRVDVDDVLDRIFARFCIGK